MAALFARASTQFVRTSDLPVTNHPFTVGFWTRMTAPQTNNQTFFSLTDTGTTNHFFVVNMNASEVPGIGAGSGGVSVSNTLTTAVSAGVWVYVLARFISATNRRLAVLHDSGLMETVAGADSRSPTGIDTMAFGTLLTSSGTLVTLDGAIAEAFVTDGDILSSDQNATVDFVRHLATNGPFSILSVANRVRFYASFRDSVDTAWIGNRDSNGLLAPVTLTTSATPPTLCDHPPLSATYERPRERYTNLLMV